MGGRGSVPRLSWSAQTPRSARNPLPDGTGPSDAMLPGTHHVAGLPLGDPQLAEVIADGLGRVEDLLRREVHSDYRFVTDTSLHLIDAGGKRFRPLLTLLAAQLGHAGVDGAPSAVTDDVITAAASVELVHLATLYHDDVMDEATMRRGAESANARWDNTVAILTGDYLFAHASRLVADLGPVAVRIIADTFAELVTGQMRETRGPAAGEDVVDHYLAVVAEKTGSLIATSGRFGAMFAGAPDEQVTAMSRFGELIGTAFQVSDDIIDIASPSGESGKTPGTDLREGVPTLPVLYALAGDGPEVPRLTELLGTGSGPRPRRRRRRRGAHAAALLRRAARGPGGPRPAGRAGPRRARGAAGRARPRRAGDAARLHRRAGRLGVVARGRVRRAARATASPRGEQRQREPHEGEADPARGRHRLVLDDHAQQELQRRVEVLQHPEGGQAAAAAPRRRRAAAGRPSTGPAATSSRAWTMPCPRNVPTPTAWSRRGRRSPRGRAEALGDEAGDGGERHRLLDQAVEARSCPPAPARPRATSRSPRRAPRPRPWRPDRDPLPGAQPLAEHDDAEQHENSGWM